MFHASKESGQEDVSDDISPGDADETSTGGVQLRTNRSSLTELESVL